MGAEFFRNDQGCKFQSPPSISSHTLGRVSRGSLTVSTRGTTNEAFRSRFGDGVMDCVAHESALELLCKRPICLFYREGMRRSSISGEWIRTPLDRNSLVGSESLITIVNIFPASLSGLIVRRRELRRISARFFLNTPYATASTVPVHTSCSRSNGSDPFAISCQFAAIFRGDLSFSVCPKVPSSLLTRPRWCRRSW